MSTARYQHTATFLANGKVLVAGGQGDYPALFATAELYDPAAGTWTPTGSMSTNRYGHTATLLTNGKVLVTGGLSFSGWLSSSEIYDPVTGSWTTTGPLAAAREYHTATLLPDGKVLVAGGLTGPTNSVTISSAELYNPISGTWTTTGSMTTNRYAHTATLLPNGKVLAVGGNNLGVGFHRTAELYDPLLGTWTATGSMLNYRFQHTATLLPNGRVLASGLGIGAPSLYNPLTGTWTDVPGPDPGASATATLLANGKVLIAGGSYGTPTAEAELFDYAIGTWALAAPMATARDGHTATLLPNGRVLVASFTNSELYNPITGTWANTGPLNSGRYNHTATLLLNGKVMVAGGINFSTVPGVELYDAASGSWTNTGALAINRIGGHTATLLLNGKVLVAGGNDALFTPPIRSAELYDSTAGTWTATGSMGTNRSGHSATLLPDGKVLVAGGLLDGSLFPAVTSTAELYDPTTGSWTAIPPMATNRSGHLSVLLPNGKVLVAGGSPASLSPVNTSAELYDPATGTWKPTGSMTIGRQGASATLLANGKVLVAGGNNFGSLSSAELYDPATGKWTATASLGAAHNSHTSTLLPNGRVLVTGGYIGNGNTNRVELYDVGQGFTNFWRPQIIAITSPLSLGGNLVITGSQFRGISEASSGNASQDSPSDYPVVQLRSLESARTVFLFCANWSTNSFTSTPVDSFPPGFAMATVFVNGIPSTGAVLNISLPLPSAPILTGSAILANGAVQFGFTNTPNSTFTVLASVNVSLPVTNWTVLGVVTETSPGQFQFTDLPATNQPQRYYRVRWP
jgi:N-acetylneuraminic acid mutarotase